MNSIILLGFFGAGKTSIGHELAKRYSYEFIELEDEVKKQTGIVSITKAYEDNLLKWREAEITLCSSLSKKDQLVIAGTSGLVENSINILYFRQNNPNHHIVYLQTSLNVIRNRLQIAPERGSRPVDRIVDKIAAYYVRRDMLYEYYAHTKIDTTSKSVEESVEEIYRTISP